MYTNTTNSITNRRILTYEISNHLPTFCILAKRPLNCADKILIRDKFLDDISNLSLKTNELILGNKDYCSNKAMTQFLEGFSKLVNQHASLRPQTRKEIKLKAKPWLSNGIENLFKPKMHYLKNVIKKSSGFDRKLQKILLQINLCQKNN